MTMTPRMFVAALVQYTSGSSSFSSNVRFRWEYQPGSELFVVDTEGRSTLPVRGTELLSRGVVVKVGDPGSRPASDGTSARGPRARPPCTVRPHVQKVAVLSKFGSGSSPGGAIAFDGQKLDWLVRDDHGPSRLLAAPSATQCMSLLWRRRESAPAQDLAATARRESASGPLSSVEQSYAQARVSKPLCSARCRGGRW
jgi:hypothetical protein